MNRALVSVLIPAYNVETYIGESIQSIMSQVYNNIEIIISDDASIDKTHSIAKGYAEIDPRIKVYKQDKNLGFVGNKNFLLSKAQGKFITFQDSDDISDIERIDQQMKIVDLFDARIVGTNYTRLTLSNSTWVENPVINLHNSGFINTPIRNYPFWFPTLLISKDVFDNIGIFNPYFNGLLGEDFYWTIRANIVYPIYYLNKPLYKYRENFASTTNVYSLRKIIMPEVLNELFNQVTCSGTDWLGKGDYEALAAFESNLISNKKFMSIQYQVWASRSIDNNNFNLAIKLLKKSISLDPYNLNCYRTLSYYLRQNLRHKYQRCRFIDNFSV